MHPGMMAWWNHARRAHSHGDCGGAEHAEHAGPGGDPRERGNPFGERGRHGHGHGHGHHGEHAFAGHDDHEGEFGGGVFGVRRPLRFLAFKLELDEEQVTELARVLNELKTDRAQAAVDHRRTTAAFADAIANPTFDEAKVKEAAEGRVKTAERLRDAVTHALGRIHLLLEPAQRTKLAYLIRTGVLTI